MNIKDYYSVLGVSPSASQAVIKQAFRRLALKYHPDKNPGNNYHDLKFKEINEAYRILSNKKRRIAYHYSSPVSKGTPFEKPAETLTAGFLVLQSHNLKKFVAASDINRMNTFTLGKQVDKLLNTTNAEILILEATQQEATDFVQNLLFISRWLPHKSFLKIMPHLVNISKTDNGLLVAIRKTDKDIKMNTLWIKFRFVIVLLLVFLFCLYIYIVSN